jgi:hypothetical protein
MPAQQSEFSFKGQVKEYIQYHNKGRQLYPFFQWANKPLDGRPTIAWKAEDNTVADAEDLFQTLRDHKEEFGYQTLCAP